MPNPELPAGEYERAITAIDQTAQEIRESSYILKNLGRFKSRPNLRLLDNPDNFGFDPDFVHQQFAETVEALKNPFYCFSCCKGFSTSQGVLAHLNGDHKDIIHAEQIEDHRTAKNQRLTEENQTLTAENVGLKRTVQQLREHERIVHGYCNEQL